MGGSGKRQLADGAPVLRNTIGKLRRLRLPLPPLLDAWNRSQTLRGRGAKKRLQGQGIGRRIPLLAEELKGIVDEIRCG